MSLGAGPSIAKMQSDPSKATPFNWAGLAGVVLNVGTSLVERRQIRKDRQREERLFREQATRQSNRPPPVAVEQAQAGFSFFDIPLLGPLLKSLFGG